MKQFDHMIERKLNLELSNVFPRLSNVFPRLKFLAGCGQFSDFSNSSGVLPWLEVITRYKYVQVLAAKRKFYVNSICGVKIKSRRVSISYPEQCLCAG